MAPPGMSAHQLSLALRVPATRINDIVNEKRGITADTALRLSRYFGTTPRFWMNMQASWELEAAEDQLGKAVRREVPPTYFGWVQFPVFLPASQDRSPRGFAPLFWRPLRSRGLPARRRVAALAGPALRVLQA